MLEFRVLGPLLVTHDGNPVTLRAPMWRRLLAVLLCRAGASVPVSVLIEALWGESPPRSARKTVQVYIRRLRQVLGEDGRILHGGDGYAALVAPDEMDAFLFDKLTEQARVAARNSELESAGRLFEQALGLWQGPAYAGLDDIPLVADEARRLEGRRLLAHEDFIAVSLDLGRHSEVVAELSGMTNVLPYRERLCALLMLALYRVGRQVEALDVFRAARATLVEELGVEPGPVLQHMHEAILREGEGLNRPAHEILSHGLGVDKADSPDLLPADIIDFTGRDEQVELLGERLSSAGHSTAVRVSAIVGPAGVGKTALAVHMAHRLSDAFPDGRLYVDLHGAGTQPTDPGEVLSRFLVALGKEPRAIPDGVEQRAESFRALVSGRRILVVLDNAAGEAQVQPLLPGSPTCAVLLTSRRRLAGLSAHTLRLDGFDLASARALLESIAGQDRVSAEPEAAAEIVELCGHLPLALRVAGARLAAREHRGLAHLADRLRDEQWRLEELAAGDLSVRASLRLGYGALAKDAQRAFRLLGLLDAPAFPVWTAAALLDTGMKQAEDNVDALLDSGLVICLGSDEAGQLRYRFHDLVRLFARERAMAEEPAARRTEAIRRVLGGWLALAEAADQRLTERVTADIRGDAPRWQIDQATVEKLVADPLAWFDGERVAMAAAVAQACDAGLDELAWELSASMVSYYALRGLHQDWSRTHELALNACTESGNYLGKAVMSRNLAWMRMTGLKTSSLAALDKTDEALATFQERGHRHGEVDVLSLRAFKLRHRRAFEQALACMDKAMAMAERIGYELGQARLWYGRAVIHREQGRYEQASECAERSLVLASSAGTNHDRVLALWELAAACRDDEAAQRVAQRLRAGMDECRQRNERLLAAYLRLSLADLHIRFGRPLSRELILSALSVFEEYAVPFGQSEGLRLLGQLDTAEGRADEAIARLTAAAEIAGKLRNVYEHALAWTALGHAQRNRGDQAAAADAWQHARQLFEQISNSAETAAMTKLLRS